MECDYYGDEILAVAGYDKDDQDDISVADIPELPASELEDIANTLIDGAPESDGWMYFRAAQLGIPVFFCLYRRYGETIDENWTQAVLLTSTDMAHFICNEADTDYISVLESFFSHEEIQDKLSCVVTSDSDSEIRSAFRSRGYRFG